MSARTRSFAFAVIVEHTLADSRRAKCPSDTKEASFALPQEGDGMLRPSDDEIKSVLSAAAAARDAERFSQRNKRRYEPS
jgi:hypothetical protein